MKKLDLTILDKPFVAVCLGVISILTSLTVTSWYFNSLIPVDIPLESIKDTPSFINGVTAFYSNIIAFLVCLVAVCLGLLAIAGLLINNYSKIRAENTIHEVLSQKGASLIDEKLMKNIVNSVTENNSNSIKAIESRIDNIVTALEEDSEIIVEKKPIKIK